jgi:hypothetical protein
MNNEKANNLWQGKERSGTVESAEHEAGNFFQKTARVPLFWPLPAKTVT